MTIARLHTSTMAAAGLSVVFFFNGSREALAQAPAPATTPATGNSDTQKPATGDTLPAPIQDPAPPPATVTIDLSGIAKVSDQLFEDARAVASPGERALALARIARSAAYSGQLGMAHTAVMEGGEAAKAEPDGLVRDQRIDSIILVALQLAEERMREPILVGRGEEMPADRIKLAPKRQEQTRLAAEEWRYAADLARSISDPVTRTEASYRVVEGASFAVQELRGQPRRIDSGPAVRPVIADDLTQFSTRVLEAAAIEGSKIERPVWRDRALVSVAQNAAAADQFELAIRVARMIPQPEIRTDALLRIAENQAINNRNREATEAYFETAQTIAMIPLDDPREVLTGVLIDSLISLGRFDDARESTVLFQNPERRTIALAAVAESQGRRGLGKSARKWIALESPEIRPLLYRKVNDGLLTSLQMNRSRDTSPPVAEETR